MKQHYVKFQICCEWQYKKGNSTNWRPDGKDTQAPHPKMGRFVKGE